MTKNSILVLGSSNTADMIIKVRRIPKAGENHPRSENSPWRWPGGKGIMERRRAARAGGSVTFIARVGQDMFGEKAVAGFIAERINVDYIIRDRTSPSGVALIFVGQKGQNSIAVASGANSKLVPADVKRAIGAFRDASVMLLQLETPLKTVLAAAEIAAAAGVKVILNPAPAQTLSARLLSHIDVLTPNESEAELLTGVAVNGEAGAAKRLPETLARGVVRNVIITMGSQGAFVAGRSAAIDSGPQS